MSPFSHLLTFDPFDVSYLEVTSDLIEIHRTMKVEVLVENSIDLVLFFVY